jgi:hypothetical protein
MKLEAHRLIFNGSFGGKFRPSFQGLRIIRARSYHEVGRASVDFQRNTRRYFSEDRTPSTDVIAGCIDGMT